MEGQALQGVSGSIKRRLLCQLVLFWLSFVSFRARACVHGDLRYGKPDENLIGAVVQQHEGQGFDPVSHFPVCVLYSGIKK